MPAFSFAICERVSPSTAVCSKLMVVITDSTGFCTALVASSRPPSPVSRMTKLACFCTNNSSAMPNSQSKYASVIFFFCRRFAALCTLSNACTKSLLETISLSMRIRSLTSTKCGDVNSPVLKPCCIRILFK